MPIKLANQADRLLEYLQSSIQSLDQETLVESLWAVYFFIQRQNNKEENACKILKLDIVRYIVSALAHDHPEVQKCSINIMCILSYFNEEMIMSFYDENITRNLSNLLNSKYPRFRSETLLSIYNFILTNSTIETAFFNEEFIKKLIDLAITDDDAGVQCEALSVIKIFSTSKQRNIAEYMHVHEKVINVFFDMLVDNNSNVIESALNGIEGVLKYYDGEMGENKAAVYIKENLTLASLQRLRDNSFESVSDKVMTILDTYFSDAQP